ncbi:C2H2-type domain-containing protein [Fusarium keratoplasticum]|uniref:C2H2-type domain-containing protein n=1 Tax=Fusarium keratoplasticum TaxID=1328300 RepID=A0ACC0RDN8_9HYPO|nr:C2H2-type domain-containing protein [Fusarium keratoplasticum]KAI8684076.1 C2H2-type domain-containing protein [Fusarium keratoplasticum]KAI8688189.1 C2H2-type domain-containing protein [Fusarium keratoplasticum]
MDSYTSFRDASARSPVERSWSRDDSRTRDDRADRGDSFYRGRSPGSSCNLESFGLGSYHTEQHRSPFPGHERRDRRRSRSPATVDRYEPRSRRDDRDRDDRRRITSPPANIDRYVPGQEASSSGNVTVNPLADPVKLPYQVGFSYFGEWWRMNEKIKEEKERIRTGRRREPERARGPEDREKEKAKIQAAYDAYKEELQAKMARAFVSEHKREQWFKERYVPEIRDDFRAKLNEHRRGAYSQWEQDLESGTFDDFSLEGLPKSESNGSGGVVEKEEGEATATNEILGVGDLVPANGADIRDENQFQPTLLIKTIAPHVSRQNLEAFCKEHLGEEEGGFKWLSLSDPNPSKRYHRIGWVMLHPSSETALPVDRVDPKDEDGDEQITSPQPVSTADKALEAINGKTVKDEVRGDFVCHVGVHSPPVHPRKKALWDLFSAPERIDKDLLLVQRIVNKFEEEFGSDFQATLKIEEKVEDLRNAGQLQPAVPPTPVKKVKKTREVGMDEAMDEEEDGVIEVEEEEEEGAVDDEEIDDEDLLVKKKQLDLLIEYLRRVFNFCFFCVFESDSIHELTRKCPGGHLRRPRSTLSSAAKAVARASANGEPFPGKKRGEGAEEPENEPAEGDKKFRNASNKTEQQLLRAFNWVKTFEDKLTQILDPHSVDIRKLGGRPVDEAVDEELSKHVKQEDEHKWRCKAPECSKLFKEEHFWRKHVEKRHSEWLESIKQEFDLINAYVIDPAHIAPSRTDANSNGHFPPANGQSNTGTPRGFNLQNFAMNGMMGMPGFPMPPGGFTPMFANMQSGGWNPMGDDRSGGPIRRGGMGGGRGQYRSGPYDRRGGNRYDGGRNRMGGSRWGDGAGGAAGGPREAVQGRSLKSYEDLDQVSGGGGGELNY